MGITLTTPIRIRGLAKALAAALAATVLGAAPATAQEHYPARPVTLIVPFPAGGGVDAMARIVAERLTSALGQQVVIDNRGGAAGVIGTRAAARATPDGYTLAMSTSGTTTVNPTLYAEPGYDVNRDFVPVGLVAVAPIVIMAHPSFPARTVADLIAVARRDGKLDAGTPAAGTENHIAAELFHAMTGLDITIVTYKGTGPSHQRSFGWAYSRRVQYTRAGARPYRGRQPARPRGRRSKALTAVTRGSDRGGIRAGGLRGRGAVRADGANGYATSDHRTAQWRIARHHDGRRNAQTHRRSRRRTARIDP